MTVRSLKRWSASSVTVPPEAAQDFRALSAAELGEAPKTEETD